MFRNNIIKIAGRKFQQKKKTKNEEGKIELLKGL